MSFWESKLNGTKPSPVIAATDLFGVYNTPRPIQQNSIQSQEYKPSVRLKQGGNCPDCGSDKYMPFGSYAIACGECGYHPRFEQSGHGERSLNTKPGEAAPSRQTGDHQTMAGTIAVLNSGGGEHLTNI